MESRLDGKPKINPEEWVNNYGDYLYNYAYTRVSSKETAEDLVQETFISGLKSVSSFRGDSTALTWLMSILKRKIIDYYRKKSNKKEHNLSSFSSPFQDEEGIKGHWILERAPKDWQRESNSPLREEEFNRIMEICLAGLPAKWRGVFVLKVMEELETSEVCKEMGCTSSNLWVILHRARLKLRECIENNWLNE